MKSKWLLVEDNLHQKEALVAARVPFTELAIGRPRPVQGLAFPEEEKARMLEILGLSSIQLIETETDREGVFLLTVRPTATGTVVVADWNGKNKDDFVKAIQELLVPVVGDVVLSVPHRNTVAPASDGKFHVFFWSAPAGQAGPQPPEKIWGVPVDCRDPGFLPSEQGVPITDPETGWVVGELVVESNLYIHHDLCHHGTDREIQIFRRLLREVAAELTLSPEQKSERQRKLAEAERERSRQAYIKECGRRLSATIEATRRSIEEARKTIERAQREIVEAVRAEAGFRKKLEQLTSSKADVERQFVEEFNRLLQVPGVEKVLLKDGIVSVFTENVEIPFNGNLFDIGRFRVDIYTSGAEGGVRCFNLTWRPNGYCHPHIKGDGQCCFGNIADGVAKLIGEYQYSVLAQVMLQYLRSVNPGDWYCDIRKWPVKKPAKEVKE